MEMWTSDTCSKYEKDDSLPAELADKAGNTCLSCKHSSKVASVGEIDIVPCGNPVPIKHGSFPTPR